MNKFIPFIYNIHCVGTLNTFHLTLILFTSNHIDNILEGPAGIEDDDDDDNDNDNFGGDVDTDLFGKIFA